MHLYISKSTLDILKSVFKVFKGKLWLGAPGRSIEKQNTNLEIKGKFLKCPPRGVTGPNVEHVVTHTIWLHSLAANQDTYQLPRKSNDLNIKKMGRELVKRQGGKE